MNRRNPYLSQCLVVLVALISLAALPLNAFSKDLVVYSSVDEENAKKILNEFTKSTGTKVQMVFLSTGPALSRIEAEKANPQADVWFGAPNENHVIAKNKGLSQTYVSKNASAIDANFRDPQGYWHAFYMNPLGMGILVEDLNKRGIKVPAAWTDLLNPAYKGLIVMPNPASSGTGYLTVSALIQLLGEKEAWDYLDRLHQNIMQYTHSGSKPAKMAGQGEAVIGISFGYRGLKQKSKGEPVETVWPASGAGWDLEANALVKKAKIKDAARTFLDFAISGDAMKMYAAIYPITSIESGVPTPEGYPADPMSLIIKNDLTRAAFERDRILTEWSKRYDGKSESR